MSVLTETTKTLMKQGGYKNAHDVPRVVAAIVHTGVGKQRDNASMIAAIERDLAAITGQKPHQRPAKKAVSGFTVREGNLVGLRVTLRGKRMEDFIQRFVRATLPRVRDFRGIPFTALDAHGNLNVGLREHLPFPEIRPEQTDVIFGLQVTFVTTAASREEGRTLFKALGFPLAAEEAPVEKKK